MYELSASKIRWTTVSCHYDCKSGLLVQVLYIPFIGDTELGWPYPITVFWLVGITNAINLIDGLDGLSAGISSIVLATLAYMAFTSPWGTGTAIILPLALIILASTIGFLFYNFHPAKFSWEIQEHYFWILYFCYIVTWIIQKCNVIQFYRSNYHFRCTYI